ncbi:MAG: MobP2 family relaxase [Streptococcus anginosus]|nr:MobP2 family relaxase [Streptococcus anginosus]
MSEITSPKITFMLQYTEANAQYVDYTNRDEAVELENELSLENHKQVIEDLTEEQIKEIKKAVPEQNLNFKEYIDYMNRSYATEQQNQEWTAVFNQDANYLQTKRVDQLKRNLEEAYQNGSLLWQGVISFDNEFLAQEGLYDKATGHVDQQAIKNVIREAMPKVIQKEGLSDSAFWWGNIHLNTDNIHVHIGLSEINSYREKIFYRPRGRMEYRGNFSQKTIKQLKSDVFHGLINEQTRNMIVRKEQVLANLKSDLLTNVFKNNQVTLSAEKNFLEQAYNHLPFEKQWRYASNAKDFAVSKFFINKYLDSYFENEGKEDYQKFLTETREFLEMYEGVYSAEKNQTYEKLRYVNGKAVRIQGQSKGYEIEKLIHRREHELRERLGNQILQKFKQEVPRIANVEPKNNIEDFSKGNQERIRQQCPDATFVHLADVWEKMGYLVPEEAIPIIILKPEVNGNKAEKPTFVPTKAYDISQVQEDVLNKRMNLKQLSLLSSDELKELVDAAKNKANRTEKERQELGTFRYALKLSLLKEQQATLLIQKRLLEQMNPLKNDQTFVTFKKIEIEERLKHIEFQLTPNFKLKKGELAEKEKLSQKFEDSVQFSISKASAEKIQVPINRLNAEIRAVSSLEDKSILSLLKGQEMTKEGYIDELKTHVTIFQVKHRIYNNNQIIAETKDDSQIKNLKKENVIHFSELKKLYRKLLPESESEKQSKIAQAVSKSMQEKQQIRQLSLQQSQAPLKISKDFMRGLTLALKNAEKGNMRAFMEKVRADERAEREEQAQQI